MIVFHIASREIRSMLTTVVGWMVICGFLLLAGVFWISIVSNYVMLSQDLVFNPYAASQLTFSDYLVAPWFENCLLVAMFLAPAITMRSFSGEYTNRTFELLLTSPISTGQVVLGKYIGAMGFSAVMLAFTMYVPLWLSFYGEPDPGLFIGGYLSLILTLSVLSAGGLLVSSYTRSQVVAFVLTFAAGLGVYVVSWLAQDPDSILAHFSLASHVQDVHRGVIRLSDVVWFAGVTVTLLFATQQRLDGFRWR